MTSVAQSRGKKFDLQLSQALIDERRLADIFTASRIEKVELKSESYLWEKTGNICVEYRSRGAPSGIAATEADYWVHELKRDGATLLYFMFPVERLKRLCRDAFRAGRVRSQSGDDGEQDVVLLRIADLIGGRS